MRDKSIMFRARRGMGWSQEQTARYAGVSTRTVCRAENKRTHSRTLSYFWLLQPIPQDVKTQIVEELKEWEYPYD